MQYTTKATFPMMYKNMSRVYLSPEQHEMVFGKEYFSIFFIGSNYEYYFVYDTPEKKNIVMLYVLRFDTPSIKLHKTIDMLIDFKITNGKITKSVGNNVSTLLTKHRLLKMKMGIWWTG